MKSQTKKTIKRIAFCFYYGLIGAQAFIMSIMLLFIGIEVYRLGTVPSGLKDFFSVMIVICFWIGLVILAIAICRGIYFFGNAIVKTIYKIKFGNNEENNKKGE